jgi:hypothetical protein
VKKPYFQIEAWKPEPKPESPESASRKKDRIQAVIEALGAAILFVVIFGFAGMVIWEIAVSVWRHFPQGW